MMLHDISEVARSRQLWQYNHTVIGGQKRMHFDKQAVFKTIRFSVYLSWRE